MKSLNGHECIHFKYSNSYGKIQTSKLDFVFGSIYVTEDRILLSKFLSSLLEFCIFFYSKYQVLSVNKCFRSSDISGKFFNKMEIPFAQFQLWWQCLPGLMMILFLLRHCWILRVWGETFIAKFIGCEFLDGVVETQSSLGVWRLPLCCMALLFHLLSTPLLLRHKHH